MEERDSTKIRAGGTARWRQQLGFYGLALLLLGTLGATLVAATRVDASGSLKGPGADTARLERHRDHAAFAVGWMLHRIDASDAQEVAIQDIVARGLDEFHAVHAEEGDMRARAEALLTAEPLDPDAIEAFRQAQLERIDRMSRRVTELVTAVAEELEPEQRRQLAELARRHHGRHAMRHGRPGWRQTGAH